MNVKVHTAIKCTAHPEPSSTHAFWNVLGHTASHMITNAMNHVDHHAPDGHQMKSKSNVLMLTILPLHHPEQILFVINIDKNYVFFLNGWGLKS